MLYVFIAALFSVSVSVALKQFKQYHLHIVHILAFNYLSASLLAFIFLKPNFTQLDLSQAWWVIAILSLLLPAVFWCLNFSLQQSGLIKTEIAQRISVVLTLTVSSLIYQEHFSLIKVVGILLGLIAVMVILMEKNSAQIQTKQSLGWGLLAVWIGYACIDLLFKYTASFGLQFSATLSCIFMLAAALLVAVSCFKPAPWQRGSICAGILLGLLNFGNIYFYLKAHQLLSNSPTVVFASMNILVVSLGVMAALVLFKEKLSRYKIGAGLLAIAAIYCLMLAMH